MQKRILALMVILVMGGLSGRAEPLAQFQTVSSVTVNSTTQPRTLFRSGVYGQTSWVLDGGSPFSFTIIPASMPVSVFLSFRGRWVPVRQVVSADDGSYFISLPPGTYLIGAAGPEFFSIIQPVTVTAGHNTNLDIYANLGF